MQRCSQKFLKEFHQFEGVGCQDFFSHNFSFYGVVQKICVKILITIWGSDSLGLLPGYTPSINGCLGQSRKSWNSIKYLFSVKQHRSKAFWCSGSNWNFCTPLYGILSPLKLNLHYFM